MMAGFLIWFFDLFLHVGIWLFFFAFGYHFKAYEIYKSDSEKLKMLEEKGIWNWENCFKYFTDKYVKKDK